MSGAFGVGTALRVLPLALRSSASSIAWIIFFAIVSSCTRIVSCSEDPDAVPMTPLSLKSSHTTSCGGGRLLRTSPRACCGSHRTSGSSSGCARGSERPSRSSSTGTTAPLLAFCRHMLGSVEEAEDAVQHTLSAAYRDLAASERRSTCAPWLYTIARDRCLAMLRARRDNPRASCREPDDGHLASDVERARTCARCSATSRDCPKTSARRSC